jgi:transposase
MADVPDELVGWKVQHSVKRERQFHNPEIWSQMAAVRRARANEQVSNLAR